MYSHAFAPQVGGIETFMMYLARGLSHPGGRGDARPIEVTVVTQTPGREDESSSDRSFIVERRPGTMKLWELIRGADAVFLAGPAILPLLFALILRKRTIVSHHGYQSICPNGMLFQFPLKTCCTGHFAAGSYGECLMCNTPQEGITGSIRLLGLTFVRRILSRLAASNVAVSEHVAMRIALPRLRMIRNGVPDVPLHELPHAVASGAPPTFAYVGRLVTEKGVNVLIEAASILKDRGRQFEVLIIGDGPERRTLEGQVESLHLTGQIRFLGFLFGASLREILTCVSAILMPSICEDVAPFSVLEQMMQGRLIIGSKIGGLAEQIGEAGLTFSPGSSLELADRMQRVVEVPGVIPLLGKQARERALKSYTLERMISEYRDLLHGGLRNHT
jgi:glycosyltransferase involved in cell wall biosynthesis